MRSNELGVVIVHHRSADTLVRVVRDLSAAGVEHAYIQVVDNSMDDSTSALLRRLPSGVRLEEIDNHGYADAVNTGVRLLSEAHGEMKYVLVVTHDVRISKATLESMVARLDSDSSIGAVGPLLVDGGATDTIWSAGGRSTKLLRLPRHHHGGRPAAGIEPTAVDVDWLDGALVLYRASILAREPLLVLFFLYVEEYEYHTRLKKLGNRIVCDRSVLASQTSNGAPPFLLARNLQLFQFLHGGAVGVLLAVPIEACREVVKLAVGRRRPAYVVEFLGGWMAGWKRRGSTRRSDELIRGQHRYV